MCIELSQTAHYMHIWHISQPGYFNFYAFKNSYGPWNIYYAIYCEHENKEIFIYEGNGNMDFPINIIAH